MPSMKLLSIGLALLAALFDLATQPWPAAAQSANATAHRPSHALTAEASAHAAPAARTCCALPVAAGNVRLNEILAGPARDWDGSGAFSSRDDEWIEIANVGGIPENLTGYFVTDGDTIPRYAFTGTLPASGVLLVTGKMSYDWEKANAQPAFGLSLGNSGDSVMLWQVVGADTVLVDSYTYKSHEAGADRSVGRSLDAGGDWQLFDALDPYTGTLLPQGNHCAPSPGAPNACSTTPARNVTWGSLKAAYR
jgi:hypothetical protein